MPDKVLVVDDESDILDLARMILEEDGYCVVQASDGEGALRKAEAENPDLILLDVVMPGKSGLEVCRALKAQAKTRHIPIVIFTVFGRYVDKKLSEKAGADGFFNKPFSPQGLLREVTQRLKKAREEKFSSQLGLGHSKLLGKRILFEFDPSTPYERLIRDFVVECASRGEKSIVITSPGSILHQALEGYEGIEFVDFTSDIRLSPILQTHPERPLSLVFDSISDLVLLENIQVAYRFIVDSIKLLYEPKITGLFLLNPSAHEPKDVSSIKDLFSSQVTYGKQGITSLKII